MPSMTPMMSAILRLACVDAAHGVHHLVTTSPPHGDGAGVHGASLVGLAALSAFWRTVAPSCSMEAGLFVPARWPDCSVRADRSQLPWAIWALAVATLGIAAHAGDHAGQAGLHLTQQHAAGSRVSSRPWPLWGWSGRPAPQRGARSAAAAR